VYTSNLDGFGTLMSDLDLYIVRPAGPEGRSGKRRSTLPPGDELAAVDAEFWSQEDVDGLCRLAVADRARLDELKVVHRLRRGLLLSGRRSDALESLTSGQLDAAIAACLRLLSVDDLRGTEGFLLRGDLDSALLSARRALTYACMTWCSLQGTPVFKEKWIPRALHRLDPELERRYWDGQLRVGDGQVRKLVELSTRLIENKWIASRSD
jgi:hypothetical protein